MSLPQSCNCSSPTTHTRVSLFTKRNAHETKHDTDMHLISPSEFDPWRSASVSSELRPGGPLQSTKHAPVHLIPGARHCDDLDFMGTNSNGEVTKKNADVLKVQAELIKQMAAWVAEWYVLH